MDPGSDPSVFSGCLACWRLRQYLPSTRSGCCAVRALHSHTAGHSARVVFPALQGWELAPQLWLARRGLGRGPVGCGSPGRRRQGLLTGAHPLSGKRQRIFSRFVTAAIRSRLPPSQQPHRFPPHARQPRPSVAATAFALCQRTHDPLAAKTASQPAHSASLNRLYWRARRVPL